MRFGYVLVEIERAAVGSNRYSANRPWQRNLANVFCCDINTEQSVMIDE